MLIFVDPNEVSVVYEKPIQNPEIWAQELNKFKKSGAYNMAFSTNSFRLHLSILFQLLFLNFGGQSELKWTDKSSMCPVGLNEQLSGHIWPRKTTEICNFFSNCLWKSLKAQKLLAAPSQQRGIERKDQHRTKVRNCANRWQFPIVGYFYTYGFQTYGFQTYGFQTYGFQTYGLHAGRLSRKRQKE